MWAFFSFCRKIAEPIPNQQLSSASSLDGFVRWTKTFVSHFLAKRALEQHCLKLPAKEQVRINIITTDRSPLRYPTWPVLSALVGTVVESSKATGNGGIALDRAEAVKKLEQRILSEKKQHKFLRAFRQMVSSKDPTQALALKFPSGLHCEFILAAFLLYPKEANPVKDELLLKIAKVLLFSIIFTHWITNHCQAFTDQQGFSIAVSKLLCPACWEGLLFLDETKQFDVFGHHFVPYAVELPSWLPPAVVDAMCERFRALVTEELQVLLESPDVSLPSSSGIPRQSQESQSNISVASSHTTDHMGADHLKESFAGALSFIKVSLFLHVPFLKDSMVWSDSEFVGYST
jgi:hypothetical protein